MTSVLVVEHVEVAIKVPKHITTWGVVQSKQYYTAHSLVAQSMYYYTAQGVVSP
jgi:hypothetical protein